jgi:hypothetical protein
MHFSRHDNSAHTDTGQNGFPCLVTVQPKGKHQEAQGCDSTIERSTSIPNKNGAHAKSECRWMCSEAAAHSKPQGQTIESCIKPRALTVCTSEEALKPAAPAGTPHEQATIVSGGYNLS